MKNLTFMICLLCLLSACESGSTTESEQTVEETTEQDIVLDNKQCFLWKNAYDTITVDGKEMELADVIELSLTITETDVVGIYNYIPAEKDGMFGEFEGTIDDAGKITAIYTYMQEGNEDSEEMIIELKDNEAIIYEEKIPKVACAELEPDKD